MEVNDMPLHQSNEVIDLQETPHQKRLHIMSYYLFHLHVHYK